MWFDVRCDWNALFFLYGIQPGWVRDLQFLELLCRYKWRHFIKGLRPCMEDYGENFTTKDDLDQWVKAKKEGHEHFEKNG